MFQSLSVMIRRAVFSFTELRADRLYTSLVRAMAMGKSTPGDIAKAVGRHSAADIFDPLHRLVDLGIVAWVTALTTHGERRSRSRYHICAISVDCAMLLRCHARILTLFSPRGDFVSLHPDLIAEASHPEKHILLMTLIGFTSKVLTRRRASNRLCYDALW